MSLDTVGPSCVEVLFRRPEDDDLALDGLYYRGLLEEESEGGEVIVLAPRSLHPSVSDRVDQRSTAITVLASTVTTPALVSTSRASGTNWTCTIWEFVAPGRSTA